MPNKKNVQVFTVSCCSSEPLAAVCLYRLLLPKAHATPIDAATTVGDYSAKYIGVRRFFFFSPVSCFFFLRARAPARTAGSKKAPAPPRFGGDDLEDDGYYDPEDVPDAHFEADHGIEDQFGSKGGAVAGKAGGAGTTASAKSKKKNSKVVVF